MATWWLAIDRKYTSYDELKHRKVVAQGWPDLGNLLTLCPLVDAGDQGTFLRTVDALERIAYGTPSHADRVMWDLLSIKSGDLVVGAEGLTVRGICELTKNGSDSYHYQSPEAYNYAQTIGFPAVWVDWNTGLFGAPPRPPAQGPSGVERLTNESQRVTDAWNAYQRSHHP